MASEEWRRKGNEEFKLGNYLQAASCYDKSIEQDPRGSYLALSNRSLTYCKLEKYDLALSDAENCVSLNPKWAKGYLRKAVALNLLKKHEEAQKVSVDGFAHSDVDSVSLELVKEWLAAGKALMAIKHSQLMEKLAEVIPEYAVMFCDAYCNIMFSVVTLRLSDASGMSHKQMVDAIDGTVNIAKDVMECFHQPPPTAMEEFAKAACVRIDIYPESSVRAEMKQKLEHKAEQLVKWLDDSVHPSLAQVMKPIVLLLLSAIMVCCNSLCQMYAGHNMGEFLGAGCAALFSGKAFSEPMYSALNLGVLNILLTVHRTKGEVPSNGDIESIRTTCHKMDFLLQKLPPTYPNYGLIKSHYEQSVKVGREICAKVLSGFSKSHDSQNALSELEIAYLEAKSDPDKATDVALKYLQDIAHKISMSESGNISHINFIDAENMLYLTGIFVRLENNEMAQKVFQNGENMVLSLLATVLKRNIISLDELPATVTNARKLVLSGALALKDTASTIAVDALIRWKSFFTELRAILNQLGLNGAYKEAFLSLETCAKLGDENSKMQVLTRFKQIEAKLIDGMIVPIVNGLYHQKAVAISKILEETDFVLDYSFFIYDPEYQNPPRHQAYGLAITLSEEPVLFMINNENIFKLIAQLPKAVYSLWSCHEGMLTHPVLAELAELLFPQAIREAIFKRGTKRLFFSPDVDLLCFPIDLLPLTNEAGITKSLFEHFSISFLSSPRELLRTDTIKSLKKDLTVTAEASNNDDHDLQKSSNVDVPLKEMEVMRIQDEKQYDCFLVANPNFDHRLVESHSPSLASAYEWLFKSLSSFFGVNDDEEDSIPPLPNSEKEAENVCTLLSLSQKLKVHPIIKGSEATIASLLHLTAPYILHIATHGYCGKQVNRAYRGNFWTDTSAGILLSGAKVFQQKKFEVMDPKMGTGHMNAVAACGMQLNGTQLVFISACNSSVGSRPAQEMPNSFTQALRSAGANTIISTLWTITDDETVEFVSYFYDCLVSQPFCRPSQALTYAKSMMKTAGKSMFIWGAFVCHGLDKPLFN